MKKLVVVFIAFLIAAGGVNVCAVSTSAKSAILINGDTGEIIYGHNENMQLSMASTTKIMTSLLLCEYGHFEDTVTVTEDMVAVEGTSMGLLAGDTVSFHDLLYGMLLASGNDAANVTATAIGGSVVNFVALMNKRAAEIGMKNTHFATPSGLDDTTHYSTAYDMALLAKTALQNKDFAAACSSKSATLCYGNPPYKRTLKNHNRLLNMYGDCIGVKTGYTKKSGRCLVSAAKRENKYLIAVTLNDKNDWQDHINLFNYGFSQLMVKEIKCDEKSVKVPVVNGNKGYVLSYIEDMPLAVANNCKITYKINKRNFLYAPVNKGDVIATVDYYIGGKFYKSVNINANENIAYKSESKSIFNLLLLNIKSITAKF